MSENETASSTPARRTRRRAERPSDAEGIDRSADLPDDRFGVPTSWDSEREVVLDDDDVAEPSLDDDEYWREERPPHYG